jgi:hypothetical protein
MNIQELTFAELPDADFSENCISFCGNAADPVAYASYEGSRASGMQTIMLESTIADDRAIAAAEKWRELLEAKHGPDYVMDGGYKCNADERKLGFGLFKSVHVTKVSKGYTQENMGFECDAYSRNAANVARKEYQIELGRISDGDVKIALSSVKDAARYCSFTDLANITFLSQINDTALVRINDVAYIIKSNGSGSLDAPEYVGVDSKVIVKMRKTGTDKGVEGEPIIPMEMTVSLNGKSLTRKGQMACAD